ncbi:MAG: PhnD/SsuA/transferrin family substrate-binding protein [Aquabacterium sp.]|nr:PhnD/SsuA/transferrin family substrate-binding protein [Aquabacterium sp.]
MPVKNTHTQTRQYRPLITALEAATGRRVQAEPAKSYGSVIEGLLAGDIDLAEVGPASYAIAMKRGAQIDPIASFTLQPGPATPSSRAYHSVLITRHDHPARPPGTRSEAVARWHAQPDRPGQHLGRHPAAPGRAAPHRRPAGGVL